MISVSGCSLNSRDEILPYLCLFEVIRLKFDNLSLMWFAKSAAHNPCTIPTCISFGSRCLKGSNRDQISYRYFIGVNQQKRLVISHVHSILVANLISCFSELVKFTHLLILAIIMIYGKSHDPINQFISPSCWKTDLIQQPTSINDIIS